VPVFAGRTLLRIDGDKEYAVTGTKGHLWELEGYAHTKEVDFEYFQKLVDDGRSAIEKFGSFADFTRP
jgi:hypothetical protein